MDNIQEMIRLCLEVEGALRVIANSDTPEARIILKEKSGALINMIGESLEAAAPEKEAETPVAYESWPEKIEIEEEAPAVTVIPVDEPVREQPQGGGNGLAARFTINDRFRFIRGIFCDDADDFDRTVDHISSLESLGDVYDYLLNDLGWDIENDDVKEFICLVANHFNSL